MASQTATAQNPLERMNSMSQASETSQTAQEFINSQLQLEADAREALPYQFDTCTRPMGALRQILFSCLTCNPPTEDDKGSYKPAGLCYSCSISCHGEHTLVELFNKRNFVCDCGTTRVPESTPCALRLNTNGGRGGVTGESPAAGNKYNQNFRNIFCGCGEDYDAFKEKGTMFQCLGLGTVEQGGCGEDWWHPECVVGLPRRWYEKEKGTQPNSHAESNTLQGDSQPLAAETDKVRVVDNRANGGPAGEDVEPPAVPGFPTEEDFEHFICYKCVDANPWIKQYAGTPGFLPAVFYRPQATNTNGVQKAANEQTLPVRSDETAEISSSTSLKRKAENHLEDETTWAPEFKRQRSETDVDSKITTNGESKPLHESLPVAPQGRLSLFLKEDFRTHFCRCASCFPRLSQHPQLLDEEDTYEPPLSESSEDAPDVQGNRSTGSRSLLDRGEAALSNIDRVRAIEGVMVYNHLKDKVKDFLKPFAESGQPVSAEDIKAYFEKLRGDDMAMREARAGAANESAEGNGDNRKEQSGY